MEHLRDVQYQRAKASIERSLKNATPDPQIVAHVVFDLYGKRFLCIDPKRNMWFELIDGMWEEIDDISSIKVLIIEGMIDIYYIHKALIAERQRGLTEGKELCDLETYEKRCIGIITCLKTVKFQNKLMKSCSVLFSQNGVTTEKDEKPFTVKIGNGIYKSNIDPFVLIHKNPSLTEREIIAAVYKDEDTTALTDREVELRMFAINHLDGQPLYPWEPGFTCLTCSRRFANKQMLNIHDKICNKDVYRVSQLECENQRLLKEVGFLEGEVSILRHLAYLNFDPENETMQCIMEEYIKKKRKSRVAAAAKV
jgi:hypothetical protein